MACEHDPGPLPDDEKDEAPDNLDTAIHFVEDCRIDRIADRTALAQSYALIDIAVTLRHIAEAIDHALEEVR